MVGAADVLLLLAEFGSEGDGLAGDFDNNGSVGVDDIDILAAYGSRSVLPIESTGGSGPMP